MSGWRVFALMLPLILAGYGQVSPGAAGPGIPRAFWHGIDRLVQESGFPREPSASGACRIVLGGLLRIGHDHAFGRCATTMRRPSAEDLRLVPAGAHAQAAWTVVLSQVCGNGCSATFTYVIAKSGAVLGEGVQGHPPQLWK